MIKKIAIASIAVLALAGCASTKSADPVPVVTVTEQAPAPVDPPVTDTYASAEDTYLADAHAMDNSYIEATTDSDLLDIGNATCAALNEGNTITDILTYLVEEGTFTNGNQAEAGGILIAAAVVDLCPEYTSELEAFLTQSS
jgi:PBP1b-binding outer membrane lipoprotein LpoB